MCRYVSKDESPKTDGVAQVRLFANFDVVSTSYSFHHFLVVDDFTRLLTLKKNNMNLYILQAIRVFNLLPAFLYLRQNVNFCFYTLGVERLRKFVKPTVNNCIILQ